MNASSIYSNLPVYRDCYAVMLEFAKVRPTLPRDTRYTVAQDLSRTLVEMMVTIYRANSSRADKARLIAELRRGAVELQIYFRLLSDMRQLGAQRAAFFMEKVASIGKQLAAWHRSAARDAAGEPPEPRQGSIYGAKMPPPAGGRPECGGLRPAAASHQANPICGRVAPGATDPAPKGGLAETTGGLP